MLGAAGFPGGRSSQPVVGRRTGHGGSGWELGRARAGNSGQTDHHGTGAVRHPV